MDCVTHYDSPLGGITLGNDDKALPGLWSSDQKYFADSPAKQYEVKELPVFEETERWLDIYFSGEIPDFTPPLLMEYSNFRESVWRIMLSIPHGHTMTYGEITDKVAEERGLENMSAQAVGGATGHNSISLIIPCHRVVGSNGSLTGYAGGVSRKVQLLTLERANIEHFLVPKKGTAL